MRLQKLKVGMFEKIHSNGMTVVITRTINTNAGGFTYTKEDTVFNFAIHGSFLVLLRAGVLKGPCISGEAKETTSGLART